VQNRRRMILIHHGDRLRLQFHAEVTPAGFRRWQDGPAAMYGRPGAQSRRTWLMKAHDARQGEWFHGFLGQLFGAAGSRRSRDEIPAEPTGA